MDVVRAFSSIDVVVPSLEDGLAFWRDKLELAEASAVVQETGYRWILLACGPGPGTRLLEAPGSGGLTERVAARSYGFEQLSFTTDDPSVVARKAEKVGVSSERVGRDGAIRLVAHGTPIEVQKADIDRAPKSQGGTSIFNFLATADLNVPSLEDALEFYVGALGLTQTSAITDWAGRGALRSVSVGIGDVPVIGLLQPTGPGPLQERIDKVGYGFHQFSFVVTDARAIILKLRERGLNVFMTPADWGDSPNEPGPTTDQGFVHPRSSFGVLVEFYRKATYDRLHPRAAELMSGSR